MKFLDTAELVAVLPSAWGAESVRDAQTIRELARQFPGFMRRIHDIASLCRPSFDLVGWIYESVGPERPIDLLSEGEEGLRRLDARMVEMFRAVAPREIFDVPGRPTDKAGEGEVLVRLLQDRADALGGPGGEIHDVMRFDGARVGNAGRRLASAVRAFIADDDSRISRRVFQVAVADPDPEVRRAAVEAGAWLLGYPEVLDAIALRRGDENVNVRLSAVRALAPRVQIFEVAAELATFLDDADPKVRRLAMQAFLGRSLPRGITILLVNAVFDRDPEVARLAEIVVPEAEIIHNLRRIVRDLEEGREIDFDEMSILARSEQLGAEEKERAFVAVLERLVDAPEGPKVEELHRVMNIMRLEWRGEMGPTLWSALAHIVPFMKSELMQTDMVSLVGFKARTSDAWVFIEALLPVLDAGRATALAELVISRCAPVVPSFVFKLIDCIDDERLAEEKRSLILRTIPGIGMSRAAAEALAERSMDERLPPRLAKDALVSATAMTGPEGRIKLLTQALRAPAAAVRDYAASALEVLTGEPAARILEKDQQAEQEKVVDLTDARRRRLAARTSKIESDE